MNPNELARVAGAMVAKGKGLLAADESTGTIKKRLDSIHLESTEENHRAYRELLFTAPGAAESISAVIMYDETIRQKTKDGTPFPQYLARQGMIPGIKVDLGAKPLAGFPGETITEGLDGLRERLIGYRSLGARFAKWRAVIDIADDIPTAFAIEANAHALARYAALCQENEIVPIVEPEVLMDGAHSLDRCAEVTEQTLQSVFEQLFEQRIMLECMVLKPNMVISGKKAANRAPPQAVAEATVRVLKRHVPPAVPGIAFLSGGQSPAEATLNLSLINQLGPLPWSITFSYGRALQDEALRTWGGSAANVAAAQKEFVRRAKLTALATTGRYASDMESRAA
jgi:fructose-bisphosphate aldolase, class I